VLLWIPVHTTYWCRGVHPSTQPSPSIPADTTARDRAIAAFNGFQRAAEEWQYAAGDVGLAEAALQKEVSAALHRLHALTAPSPQLAAGGGDSGLLPPAEGRRGGLFSCPANDFESVAATAAPSLAAAVYRGFRRRSLMLERVRCLRRGLEGLATRLPDEVTSARYSAVHVACDALGRPALLRYGRRLLSGECSAAAWAQLLGSSSPPPLLPQPSVLPPAAAPTASTLDSASGAPDREEVGMVDAVLSATGGVEGGVAPAEESDAGADDTEDEDRDSVEGSDSDADSVDSDGSEGSGSVGYSPSAATVSLTEAEEQVAAATLGLLQQAAALWQAPV
jgi:hypothetical protein